MGKSLQQEVARHQTRKDADNNELLGDEGFYAQVPQVKEEEDGIEQTGLQGKEYLETYLARCLGYFGSAFVAHAEEMLYLAKDEVARLGESHAAQDETTQKQRGEQVVAGDGIRHRVACNSWPSGWHFGMVVRTLREERLAIIERQINNAHILSHRVPRQVQGVGAIAPMDGVGLEVCLNGRVLLFGRSVVGQPTKHLFGC